MRSLSRLLAIGFLTISCATPLAEDEELAQADLTAETPSGTQLIAPVLARLSREVKSRSPQTVLGLAVYDFETQEYAGAADSGLHVSASSAKAIWVAAGLRRVGIDRIAPLAKPIFISSSNDDASKVIDLAGPNYLNEFYQSVPMTRSGYYRWLGAHYATNSPGLMPEDNYFTAKDCVAFLTSLQQGTLLDAPRTAKLKEWMTLSPRSGYGGWLGTHLPEQARATMLHKAGWLPPPYDARATNEIGLVNVGGSHWYAVAILARLASSYEAQTKFVEHASCEIYKAIANVPGLDCR